MGNVFVISGPAGSGKDAIIDGLGTRLPVTRIITTTTRRPRPDETDGHPYYFVTRATFERAVADNKFAEYSTNENDELYGVTRKELARAEKFSGIGIWKVDWKGVITAKKLFPDIVAILITAPLPILEQRLRERDTTENEIYFKERMAYTREWLTHTDIYDYTVENEQGKLDEAIEKTLALIGQHASF